jgi:hypothetical protein
MFKKFGIKLLLLTICCTVISIAGSKVFAGTSYQDSSLTNARIILCASGPDEDREAVIDDDDNGANKDEDNESVIDDDDKGANKDVDHNAIIDDDSIK